MNSNKLQLMIAAILTGTFLVPVNSTMITVGLNTIAESFGETLIQTSWIITIYLIVMAATQPVAGKLGDMFGYKRMFLIGLGLSLIGSVACAFAFNLPSMIAFRSLQALGGALAVPNGTALIRYTVPKEKMTRIFGLFGLLMGLGAAVGPLAGSFLISAWGWRGIFWINLPFLLLSFLIALAVLPLTPSRPAKVDVLGALYLALGLSGIVLFITHPETLHWWTVLLLIACIALFFRRETRFEHPLIDFALFRSPSFTGANLSVMTSNAIMYGTILIVPILFQQREMDLRMIGVLLFAYSLAMSCASYLGGWMSNAIGHKKVISLSFALQLLSLCLYLGFSKEAALWYVILSLIIGGLGSGIGMPSMQASNLESVAKEKTGVASGVFSTFRYMGSMVASALTSILVGSQTIFYILMGVAALGILISWRIKEQKVVQEGLSA